MRFHGSWRPASAPESSQPAASSSLCLIPVFLLTLNRNSSFIKMLSSRPTGICSLLVELNPRLQERPWGSRSSEPCALGHRNVAPGRCFLNPSLIALMRLPGLPGDAESSTSWRIKAFRGLEHHLCYCPASPLPCCVSWSHCPLYGRPCRRHRQPSSILQHAQLCPPALLP